MRRNLVIVLSLTGMFVVMMVAPASATTNCAFSRNKDTPPWLLSQRVAKNDQGTITTTRGLVTTLDVRSPYLHPNTGDGPSLIRQALRIQSTTSSYIEYGWEYWWQLQSLPSGGHWQRRAYYVNNVNGADYTAHYLGSIGTGPHRLWLVNAPSGTYPNKFVLTSKNLTTGTTTTHKVLDPPYDWGNAFTLVLSTDSCNEMTMQTGSSYRYSGYNNQWIRVDTQYLAGWWYGQGGDINNPYTHWIVGGWIGGYEEWYSSCYRPCTKV